MRSKIRLVGPFVLLGILIGLSFVTPLDVVDAVMAWIVIVGVYMIYNSVRAAPVKK